MRFKGYALWLSGICIAVFLLQNMIGGFTEVFLLTPSAWTQVWRFLTAVFLHAGVGHLFYNLFALALFGSILERLIGGKRFLLIFFTSGILANVFSVFFYPASLGASGAIFGVIGALIAVRPMLVVWAFGLPMPIFIAGILWAGGDLMGAIGYFTGNPIDNTGNLAHLSGMFIGLVFGLLFRDWRRKLLNRGRVQLNEDYMRNWEEGYLR